MEFEKSLIDEFVTESKDHLATCEQIFMQLEKTQGTPNAELINTAFRSIHTIKGSAGFFGLKNIGNLSHSMEHLLSRLRDAEITLAVTHVNVMLEGIDLLSGMLDSIDTSNSVEISSVVESINKLLHEKETTTKIERKIDTTNTEIIQNFELSENDLKSIPNSHRFLYILQYDLAAIERDTGITPVKIVKELMLLGTIIKGKLYPDSKDIESVTTSQKVEYHVLFSTVLEPDLLTDAVSLPSNAIVQIDKKAFLGIEKKEITEQKKEIPRNTPQETHKSTPVVQNDKDLTSGSQEKTDTVRIKVDILDRLMLLAGELVLVRNQHLMKVDKKDSTSRLIAQRLDIVTSELQETIMQTRMQPIGNIFSRFSRVVRDLGQKLGKKIEITLTGNEVEIDKTIIEALIDPLTHIIRNCCDHGIESPDIRQELGKPEEGQIQLHAYHEGGQMIIEIVDDGRGVDLDAVKSKAREKGLKSDEELSRLNDKELLSLIFLPGFSTASQVTDMSGRGVGMDVVKTTIENLGGTVEVKTSPGKGMDIYLRLPLTLAIIPSLIVSTQGNSYAIPQVNLEELVRLYDDEVEKKIEYAGSKELYRLRDSLLPLIYLEDILLNPTPFTLDTKALLTEKHRSDQLSHEVKTNGADFENRSLTFAVLRVGQLRFGLVVEKVIGSEEIVVKPLHPSIKDLQIYSGATVLGDGNVALILDSLGLARHAGLEFDKTEDNKTATTAQEDSSQNLEELLLFKNGPDEIFAADLKKIRRIEQIKSEKIEHIGQEEFITIEGTPTKILRFNNFLPVSQITESEIQYLLLPKEAKKPIGFLLTKLIDIGSYKVSLNTSSYNHDVLKGTMVVDDALTLFIDFDKLITTAENMAA